MANPVGSKSKDHATVRPTINYQPDDIILRILRLLDLPSLGRVLQCSKRLKELGTNQMLWKFLYIRDISSKIDTSKDWKIAYIEELFIPVPGIRGFFELDQPPNTAEFMVHRLVNRTVSNTMRFINKKNAAIVKLNLQKGLTDSSFTITIFFSFNKKSKELHTYLQKIDPSGKLISLLESYTFPNQCFLTLSNNMQNSLPNDLSLIKKLFKSIIKFNDFGCQEALNSAKNIIFTGNLAEIRSFQSDSLPICLMS